MVSAWVGAGEACRAVGAGRLAAVGLQLVRSNIPINNTATQRKIEVVRINVLSKYHFPGRLRFA
jgi:hypothetical protein